MKRRIVSAALALCLVLTLLPGNAWAAGAASGQWGSLIWIYDDGTKTLTISGAEKIWDIPDEVLQYKPVVETLLIELGVTVIGDGVFEGWPQLTSVDLAAGVSVIGRSAFSGCVKLAEINIPNTVNYIGSYAFRQTALVEAAVPAGVAVLGSGAFQDCASLTSVNLHSGLLEIGDEAFAGCSALSAVQIPGSVNIIRKGAFRGCSSLSRLTLSPGLENIYDEAFAGCTSLTEVTIPEGVFSVGSRAFAGCTSLARVDVRGLPRLFGEAYATILKSTCFDDCPMLNTIKFKGPEWHLNVVSKVDQSVTLDCSYPGGKCGDLYWTYLTDSNILFIEPYSLPSTLTDPTISRPADGSQSDWDDVFQKTPLIVAKNFSSIASGTFSPNTVIHYTTTWRLKSIPSDVTLHQLQGESGPILPSDPGCAAESKKHSYSCLAVQNCLLMEPLTEPTKILYHSIAGSTREAACDTPGQDYGTHCTACGKVFTQPVEIAALGHDWDGAKITTIEPTCTTDGAATITSAACRRCNAVQTDVDITIPATGHTLGDETSVVTKPATCKDTGILTYQRKCTKCDVAEVTRTEDIPKTTQHTEERIPGKEPTCGEDGLTEGLKCSVCGEILTEQKPVPATGNHTPGAQKSETIDQPAACTTDGTKTVTYECAVCGEEFTQTETIPAAHTNIESVPGKPAACTEEGLTEGSQCTGCGTILAVQEPIPALGHDWTGGTQTVTKVPTCTDAGSKTVDGAVCSRCGETAKDEIVVLPATGHAWGPETSAVTKPAACTEEGVTTCTKKCTACGETAVRTESIAALGHSYGEWITTKAPTAAQAGERTRTCSTCGHEEIEPIPATGTGFTVTFNANGGTVTPSSAVTGADGTLSALPAPSRSGFTFDGWYTAASGGTRVTTSTKFTQNTTLYARWTQNSTTPENQTYTIIFNANGGTVTPSSAATGTNGRLASLPTPVRPGYTFSGWYTNSSGGTRVTASTVFSANTVLYAHWSQNTNTPSAYYQIYTPGSINGGSLSVSHSWAAEGDLITVEVSPWTGFELSRVWAVRTDSGRELSLTGRYRSQYTFVMPASDVRLGASCTEQYPNGGGNIYSQPPAGKPVNWYYSSGCIYHVANGLVPASGLLTRDMLVSVLYNMDDSSFGDPTVWAASNGIVPDIYASWLWGGDKSISREQTAMILFCYAQYKGCSTAPRASLAGFTDNGQIRAAARPAMSWSLAAGVMTGTSASTLSPQAALTCGEANSILLRFVTNVTGTW